MESVTDCFGLPFRNKVMLADHFSFKKLLAFPKPLDGTCGYVMPLSSFCHSGDQRLLSG